MSKYVIIVMEINVYVIVSAFGRRASDGGANLHMCYQSGSPTPPPGNEDGNYSGSNNV